ncbi:MAG: hypothetical protein ACRDOI_03995 [Trebonia sp.]
MDQSHPNRDSRQFAGRTPVGLLDTEQVTGGQRLDEPGVNQAAQPGYGQVQDGPRVLRRPRMPYRLGRRPCGHGPIRRHGQGREQVRQRTPRKRQHPAVRDHLDRTQDVEVQLAHSR